MRKPNKEKNILRFVFDEMQEIEASNFLSELCSDDELWDKYEEWEGAIDEMKEAEAGPSEASLNKIMAFVEETNPNKQASKQQDKHKGWLSSLFSGANLHGMLAAAMLVFVLAGVAGSVYKVKRSQNLSPDRNNVSQKITPAVQDPSLQWEPVKINEGLEDVRTGIENLMKKDQL
ncbi:MAG: hypothetical protein MRZ79_11320 [Bacteroidia bacterium]|nr:hypothetical protein [Bacteroidia bacterium]